MFEIERVRVVEYLDDATVMKNTSVLYKIEPLKDGEIGIMRKINSLGKRPPRREMNLVSGPSNVLSTVSSMNSLPQGSSPYVLYQRHLFLQQYRLFRIDENDK